MVTPVSGSWKTNRPNRSATGLMSSRLTCWQYAALRPLLSASSTLNGLSPIESSIRIERPDRTGWPLTLIVEPVSLLTRAVRRTSRMSL